MSKQTIFQIFKKPYPFEARPRESIKPIVLIGGFVFLITLFFVLPSPDPTFLERLQMASSYGAVTILVALINSFIVSALVSMQREDTWTVGHEILLYIINITGIAIGNFFVGLYLGLASFSILAFVQTVCATLMVAIMPVVVCVLIGERNKYRKYYALAQNLQVNQFVSQQSTSVNEVCLTDGDEKNVSLDENVIFAERDILFLESDKNYIRIKLNSGQEHRVRATLKDVLERNEHLSSLIRVHRAFVVNKNCIETVDGNAQGLKLQLKNYEHVIPVSRSYINEFKSVAQLN